MAKFLGLDLGLGINTQSIYKHSGSGVGYQS